MALSFASLLSWSNAGQVAEIFLQSDIMGKRILLKMNAGKEQRTEWLFALFLCLNDSETSIFRKYSPDDRHKTENTVKNDIKGPVGNIFYRADVRREIGKVYGKKYKNHI